MSALRGTFYEWRWDSLSLVLHPLVLFMGLILVLKDVKKDASDGGRRCGGWVGHLRHSCASGLVGFMATGASKLHPAETPPKSIFFA